MIQLNAGLTGIPVGPAPCPVSLPASRIRRVDIANSLTFCGLLLVSMPAIAQSPEPLAIEGERFTVNGTQVVRYGAQSSWVEKAVTREGECSNRFFGQDPLVGVKKTCEMSAAGAPSHAVAPGAQPAPTPRVAPAVPLQPAAWGTPRAQARIFLSGHSLTDDPYGEQIVRIANSLGAPSTAKFNQQIVIGSPIRVRTGMPGSVDGYRSGKNRPWSSGMNVLEELRTGRTIGGDRYDTLILTENHNLLDMVQWENTVRQLRHYHDRLVEHNPASRTFFHSSWWDIDKSRPREWALAERSIALGWQCVGARINWSLQLAGRSDRVTPLPMSLALVDLVERAMRGELAQLGARSTAEALNLIFNDNVHLTQTGVYYASLVSYAAAFERSPQGAWHPPEISASSARWLQELAWTFVSNFYARYQEPSMDDCLTIHMPRVCDSYWRLRGQPGRIPDCRRLFDASNRDNPLRFSPADESRAWFPARP